jgi:hypothetical protein
MFRATQCSSSGETNCINTSSGIYVTLCRWLPGMLVLTSIPDGHPHQVTYTRWCIHTIRFSWWWALGCSKHVEKRNKYIQWKKVRRVGYEQELYRDTRSTKHYKFNKILSTRVIREEGYVLMYILVFSCLQGQFVLTGGGQGRPTLHGMSILCGSLSCRLRTSALNRSELYPAVQNAHPKCIIKAFQNSCQIVSGFHRA